MNKYAHGVAEQLSSYDYESLLAAKALIKHDLDILLRVSEKELNNLEIRWSKVDILMPAIMKHL